MAQTRTLIYAILKPWVRLGTFLFFRKIKFAGLEKMPRDKPIILVANHQNAMLDPLVICLAFKKQLHWLTRADVFIKPSMKRLLIKINMLPVYRERDRVSDLANKNQATFNECFLRLKQNAVICIFPEGTHRGKKQLVPLKKGTARMVMGAMDAGIETLYILPVGLDYENYYGYRKNILLTCGEPIEVKNEGVQSGFDRARNQTEITNKIYQALDRVMVNITDDEVYHEIMNLRPLCDRMCDTDNLSDQLMFFKSISKKLQEDESHHHFLKHEVKEYHSLMHQLGIREDLYHAHFPIWNSILAFVGIPFALIAGLFFSPIYYATEKFVAAVVKDPLFRNSIRLCFWTFLTPFWLLLGFLVLDLVMCNALAAIYVIAFIFVSGLITLHWRDIWDQWTMFLRCNAFKRNQNAKFAAWEKMRHAIVQRISQIK